MLKIAFVTPLSPEKTGIADYCEEILPYLKNYFEIDLFSSHTNPSKKEISENFNVYLYEDLEKEEIRSQYDKIIYQIGNNEEHHGEIYKLALKYRGIVELHDLSIEGLIWGLTLQYERTEKYLEIVEYCHGINAKKRAEAFFNSQSVPLWDEPLRFPLNKQIIDASDSVIVHSDLGVQMIKGIRKDINIAKIYLHVDEICENYIELKQNFKRELGLSKDMIFASFGFGTKTKRIVEILKGLSKLKKDGYKFKYIIVGKVEESLDIHNKLKEYNLENNVKVKGYVSLEELKKYMIACDVCLNLRFPSHGESSAILHRALGMGKFVMVTDDGTFSEYPDDVCMKIGLDNEVENITNALKNILDGKVSLNKYGSNALEYAKRNFDLNNNVLMYRSFIEDSNQCDRYTCEDILTDYLYNMGIYDEDIIKKL